jgi:homocysteine S-methyltransferase
VGQERHGGRHGATVAAEKAEPDPLARLLADDGIVVLDGGLATQLEAQGADLADALWSARLLLEDPDAIIHAHLAFFRAGAQVATTASYQASFDGFERRGIDHETAADLLRLSVTLATEARRIAQPAPRPGEPETLLVAASVGPYGAMLADGSEFRGRYGKSTADLRDFHRERMEILAAAGPDLLACETIPELAEGVALAGLLEELGSPGWLSFSCVDGSRIRSGAPVEEAFALADGSASVRAVGINCTAPEYVDELLERARSVTGKPLVVYPNSGEGWDANERTWLPAAAGTAPVRVDERSARRWVAAGARLVGGCCRVMPEAIAEVASAAAAARDPRRRQVVASTATTSRPN